MSRYSTYSFGNRSYTFGSNPGKVSADTKSWNTGARIWMNFDEFACVFGAIECIDWTFTANALRKAGRHIAKISKQNLKERMKSSSGVTGNLLHSYAVKVKKKGSRNLGVLVGFNKMGHHAHLVDQPHEIVDNRSGHAVHTGMKTKGYYFHTDVRNNNLKEAMMIAVYQMQDDLAARWEHLGKYAKRGRSNPYTGKFDSAFDIQAKRAEISAGIASLVRRQQGIATKFSNM